MAANALVQTRIDAHIRDRASAVLESMGLTVSDAVRIMLTRTATEGALPLEIVSGGEAHDAWFRAKVLEALNDTRPDFSDDEAEALFAKRRRAAASRAVEMKR
ncbi:type II toxin-antitoxin system RelB/DinJ family antitoxin [Brucella pituitosa]|uniref:type II toxin-antitoxin system RelB/DinJ family antitoxin n=1 Tax=Brucella pituitosa TaxID=571256 RepID=UPI0020037B12|nr:type II toxin-antitoxin system RelB/DinJ family antitoxin [Brucella pituitosa]MCK4207592.1 type II toxin-antitoxin system RelB/DinJ family antitoxin [Brucella pituitosa]